MVTRLNESDEISRSARFHVATGKDRRTQAGRRRGGYAPRDDRDLRPRAARRRTSHLVRKAEKRRISPFDPGTCQSVRYAKTGGAGHGRGIGAGAARSRQAARLPEGTRAAQGAEGC